MRRRLRDERGAAFTELALIVPVLMLLAMGLLEFGLAWRDSMTISTTARAGARVGSQLGDDRLTDYEILQAMKAAVAAIPRSQIQQLVVYKSTTADGAVPAVCTTNGSQNGLCNVYSQSDLDLPSSAFTGTTSCTGTSPDRFWCPTTRVVDQAAGTDYVGVFVRVRHDFITGMFPGGITVNDDTVMRVEPQPQ